MFFGTRCDSDWITAVATYYVPTRGTEDAHFISSCTVPNCLLLADATLQLQFVQQNISEINS